MKLFLRYISLVKPYWFFMSLSIIGGLIILAMQLLIPWFTKEIIDNILLNDSISSEIKKEKIYILIAIMIFFFLIIRPFIDYFRIYFSHITANKVLFKIRNTLYESIQKMNVSFFHKRKVGEIVSRIIYDVEQSQTIIRTGLQALWIDIITILSVTIIMFMMNTTLALVSLIFIPIYYFSITPFYSRLRNATKDQSQILGEFQSHITENLQGINIIQSFNNEDEKMKRFSVENTRLYKQVFYNIKLNAKVASLMRTYSDLAPIIIICLSSLLVVNKTISVGVLVAFIAYINELYKPIRRLSESMTRMTQSLASAERVFELMDEKSEIRSPAVPSSKIESEIKSISFKEVTFSYEEAKVLNKINFEIKDGEKIALVGESGGGKSTILNLIPRFFDVEEGSVLINNIDIKKMDLYDLRKQIGFVWQDNVIFSGTIRDNILLGNPIATEKEIEEAAKSAYAHHFINELKNGYNEELGEKGVQLSGGQKQRIALARVFLKNPKIILLDEATSALDNKSERIIQEALEELMKNRISIIVAHRIDTIRNVDRIFVINKGEIVETGNFIELMEKKGHFFNLNKIGKTFE